MRCARHQRGTPPTRAPAPAAPPQVRTQRLQALVGQRVRGRVVRVTGGGSSGAAVSPPAAQVEIPGAGVVAARWPIRQRARELLGEQMRLLQQRELERQAQAGSGGAAPPTGRPGLQLAAQLVAGRGEESFLLETFNRRLEAAAEQLGGTPEGCMLLASDSERQSARSAALWSCLVGSQVEGVLQEVEGSDGRRLFVLRPPPEAAGQRQPQQEAAGAPAEEEAQAQAELPAWWLELDARSSLTPPREEELALMRRVVPAQEAQLRAAAALAPHAPDSKVLVGRVAGQHPHDPFRLVLEVRRGGPARSTGRWLARRRVAGRPRRLVPPGAGASPADPPRHPAVPAAQSEELGEVVLCSMQTLEPELQQLLGLELLQLATEESPQLPALQLLAQTRGQPQLVRLRRMARAVLTGLEVQVRACSARRCGQAAAQHISWRSCATGHPPLPRPLCTAVHGRACRHARLRGAGAGHGRLRRPHAAPAAPAAQPVGPGPAHRLAQGLPAQRHALVGAPGRAAARQPCSPAGAARCGKQLPAPLRP